MLRQTDLSHHEDRHLLTKAPMHQVFILPPTVSGSQVALTIPLSLLEVLFPIAGIFPSTSSLLFPVLLSLTLEERQTLSRAYLSFPVRVYFPGRSGSLGRSGHTFLGKSCYLNSCTHQSSYQIVRRASRSTHA